MSLLVRLSLILLVSAAGIASPTWADEVAPPVATVVSFTSDEGLARLARARAKVDFPVLANQFEAQSNGAFCGPTTAAIVLNAQGLPEAQLPHDHRRLQAQDLRYLPKGADLSLPRFTQDSVIEKGAKTRAQVLGEPVTRNGKQVSEFGYQTRQLDEMLRANGLSTQLVIVDDQKPEKEIRADLIGNLTRPGDFVVINYSRKAVGQAGGGHISPLAAYDSESDSILVLDVNPSKAGWVWVPTAMLVRAMRTFDSVENRGYILVGATR